MDLLLYTAKFRVAQAHHRHFFDMLKMAWCKGLRAVRSADQRIDLEDWQEDGKNDHQDYGSHDNDQ